MLEVIFPASAHFASSSFNSSSPTVAEDAARWTAELEISETVAVVCASIPAAVAAMVWTLDRVAEFPTACCECDRDN